MSKADENNGNLEFKRGQKEFKATNYADAAQRFANAAEAYTKANIVDDIQLSYLNQGASCIAAGQLDDAILSLKAAQNAGLNSPELTQNFVAAYYNLGMRDKVSGNLDSAIASFTQAQDHDGTYVAAIYQLAITHMLKGDHEPAELLFTNLLGAKSPDTKFSTELQLNSYCKLIECKLAQKKEVDEVTLKDASTIFTNLSADEHVKHKEEASFVYSRLVAKYLEQKDEENAKSALETVEKLIPGIAHDIAISLENYALLQHTNNDTRVAMHMLLTLAHFLPRDEIVENIKQDLSDIAELLDGEPAEEFSIAVLGNISACTHDQINDLLA